MTVSSLETDPVVLPRVVPLETPPITAIACRLLDLFVAIALLLVLFPVFVLIALLIRLDTPGPVLFRQTRVGLGLSEFTMNKFRTMRRETSATPHREFVLDLIRGEDNGNGPASEGGLYKLEYDVRVTRIGGVLRRFSLDELPQLWNVVRGEMSLVGPRPALSYEVECYPPEWYRRFSIKPGMTGLWQVSGRSRLNFDQMVQLDFEYAEQRSFWLNLRILARTGRVVVLGKGAA